MQVMLIKYAYLIMKSVIDNKFLLPIITLNININQPLSRTFNLDCEAH